MTLSLLHHEYKTECRMNNIIAALSAITAATRISTRLHIADPTEPGEIMEVDWASSTAIVIDRNKGEKVKAYVFVATLP